MRSGSRKREPVPNGLVGLARRAIQHRRLAPSVDIEYIDCQPLVRRNTPYWRVACSLLPATFIRLNIDPQALFDGPRQPFARWQQTIARVGSAST
jgi:hypothetical protein